MKFSELFAAMPDELVAQFIAPRPTSGGDNPCRAWLGAIAKRELARRRGDALPEVPPLELQPGAVQPTLAWLEVSAEMAADRYAATGDGGLVLLGAMFDTLRSLVARQVHSADPNLH